MKLCLPGTDLRRGVFVLAFELLVAARGGLNAGRLRLAAGLTFGGMITERGTGMSELGERIWAEWSFCGGHE